MIETIQVSERRGSDRILGVHRGSELQDALVGLPEVWVLGIGDEEGELLRVHGEHARAVCAELATIDGVTVVPDPPVTNMAHLYLLTDRDGFAAATRALAMEDKVWTWSHLGTADTPDRVVVELTVGDATLVWTPEEAREVVAGLLERAGARSNLTAGRSGTRPVCVAGHRARRSNSSRVALEQTLGAAGEVLVLADSSDLGFEGVDEIVEALATGRAERAIEMLLVHIVGVASDDVAAFRSSPRWPVFVAGVPLVVREARVEHGWVYEPSMFDGITAPTVFLAGSESSQALREATERAVAAISGARVRVLDGYGHLATRTDPALVAGIIRDTLSI